MGVFAYSEEDGTPAASFPEQVCSLAESPRQMPPLRLLCARYQLVVLLLLCRCQRMCVQLAGMS